jgi:hypothetical protein
MSRQLFLMLFASAALALNGWAADTPNFGGEWKLNADKSDFGGRPAPDKMERKITHEGDKLSTVTTTASQMGEMTQEYKYVIDGKEHTNSTRMGDIKSVLRWQGKMLVIDSKLDIQGQQITVVDKWSLSEDGKELTSEQTVNTPMGEMTMKAVMDKK